MLTLTGSWLGGPVSRSARRAARAWPAGSRAAGAGDRRCRRARGLLSRRRRQVVGRGCRDVELERGVASFRARPASVGFVEDEGRSGLMGSGQHTAGAVCQACWFAGVTSRSQWVRTRSAVAINLERDEYPLCRSAMMVHGYWSRELCGRRYSAVVMGPMQKPRWFKGTWRASICLPGSWDGNSPPWDLMPDVRAQIAAAKCRTPTGHTYEQSSWCARQRTAGAATH